MSIYSINRILYEKQYTKYKGYKGMILALQLVRLDMNKQIRNKQQKYDLSHKNKVLYYGNSESGQTVHSVTLYSGIPTFYKGLGSKVSVHIMKVSLVKITLVSKKALC